MLPYVGKILVAMPTFTKGKLTLVPKNKEGQPLKSKVEALDDPRHNTWSCRVGNRRKFQQVAKASGGDSFHVALQDRRIECLVSPFRVLRS